MEGEEEEAGEVRGTDDSASWARRRRREINFLALNCPQLSK